MNKINEKRTSIGGAVLFAIILIAVFVGMYLYSSNPQTELSAAPWMVIFLIIIASIPFDIAIFAGGVRLYRTNKKSVKNFFRCLGARLTRRYRGYRREMRARHAL